MLLGLKTDNPEAELYLLSPAGDTLAQLIWHADRQLAHSLLSKINELMASQHANLGTLSGIVVFQGPGSFTGLRIGITVANTLSSSLGVPIVGSGGDDWLVSGARQLAHGQNIQLVLPQYGAPARITTQKK